MQDPLIPWYKRGGGESLKGFLKGKGFKHSQKTKRFVSHLGLNSIRSDDLKLKISINNSRSKTVVITNIESGSKWEFSSDFFISIDEIYVKKKLVKASKYMGISPNHFNYYLLKKPIKVIDLVVNIGGIDVTADYPINKPPANPKSLPICAIKMDTGVSHEFTSITKAAEFFFW